LLLPALSFRLLPAWRLATNEPGKRGTGGLEEYFSSDEYFSFGRKCAGTTAGPNVLGRPAVDQAAALVATLILGANA
jgi:hypothetical protein